MRNLNMFLNRLLCTAVFPLVLTVCMGGELSESEYLFRFIRAVDPENTLLISLNGLLPHPSCYKLKGLKCDVRGTTITEIRLENLNLSGRIDTDSLCKLQNIEVLSLAKNLIRGSIPNSISYCTKLAYLNLSSNLLSGRVPLGLTKLKYLRSLDISQNHFTSITQLFKQEFKHVEEFSASRRALQMRSIRNLIEQTDLVPVPSQAPAESDSHKKSWHEKWTIFIPLVVGMAFFFLFICSLSKKTAKLAKEREILKALQASPLRVSPIKGIGEVKPEETRSQLLFFVEEHERFNLEDLLEATADLQSQSICSSLYKVTLKNNTVYAVKRLKKLQVSFERFGQTMTQIGNLKHPNILPLVGYNSTEEEKLLIYQYQSNGSLLNLLENYIEGKRDFPWRLRLSIAYGLIRGLDFIYQRSDVGDIIPHGNLKLSNIMLDENEDPLISEYGISRFLDPKLACLLSSNGYTAPEKSLSEQGDVFSFGVILLELLTGRTVEKSGIDLPKWVRAMVKEEWTGEVFDKEVHKAARQWAFPLLNVSLKCVSHSPDDRPAVAEVLEKIEEIMNAHENHSTLEDNSISSMSSFASSQHECCLLHNVIPETWDTPGSNY